MLKFLRKYNKIILVIGGAILMVAFLVPQALQQVGGNPTKRKIAMTDHGPVRASDLEDAARELQVIESTLGQVPLVTGNPADNGSDRALHWLLLRREADERGFTGGPGTWSAAIDTHATLMGMQMFQLQFQNVSSMDQIRSQSEWASEFRGSFLNNRAQMAERIGSIDYVDQALARFLGVQRMVMAYRGAVRISDKAMRVIAEDEMDFAQIDYAVVRASDLTGDVEEPSEEELQAHFEKYRDEDPAFSDRRIGYRQPPRVQLEWLTIDRERVRQAVTVDPIEARKRWQTSRDRFPGEFSEEREAIERELTNEAVNDAMRLADQVVRGRALQDMRGLADDGRYKDVPDDWRSVMSPIDEIAADVSTSLEERLGETVQVDTARRDTWVALSNLASLPRLGTGFVRVGAQNARGFQELVSSALELRGPEEATGPQVGVIDGPVFDRAGNQHYFRLTDARPAGPAESIETVRTEVIENVKRLRAFDQLLARADEIEAQLESEGLRATAAALGVDRTITQGEVSRERATAGLTASDESVRNEIADAAAELDPRRAIAEQDASHRFLTAASDRAMALVLVEIVGLNPLTQSGFEQALRGGRLQVEPPVGEDPFSFAKLLERSGYEELAPRRDEDESEA